MGFPVKLRLWTKLFLVWSILFIKIPSYFSHLWNYAVKFKSKETILLVVRKKIFCPAGATKTESQMPSLHIVIELPSKEILLTKMTMQLLFVALRPSEWMEELCLVKEQRDYGNMVNTYHRTRKCLNQNVCWYRGGFNAGMATYVFVGVESVNSRVEEC